MKKHYLFLLCLFAALSSFLVSCKGGSDASCKKGGATSQTNSHEYVDLGLRSGTMWATCNVGANNPWESGEKYAWGETAEKKKYSWNTYQLCAGSLGTIKKYCTDGDYGRVDNKTLLELQDDVANVKWGGDWRLPTNAEFEELRKCTWEWTSENGVYGYKVTGHNGNSIFLPAAEQDNFHGYYWSASLCSDNSECAYLFNLRSIDDNSCDNTCDRYRACSVRPVFVPIKKSTNVKTINGHEYVDLGLPSGLKWATCNVDAAYPDEYGGYYAWGEIEEKEIYDWGTYKWRNKYPQFSRHRPMYKGPNDEKNLLVPMDDVARVKWGSTWRMPKSEELRELLDECVWEWTKLYGVTGYSVTGPNGNSIFLPAAGYCVDAEVKNVGNDGCYWSSSLEYDVYSLNFSGDGLSKDHYRNKGCLGISVRPVSE